MHARFSAFLPLLFAGWLGLTGCAVQPSASPGQTSLPLQRSTEKGLTLLAGGQAKQANAQFNQALARAPADANLHFLNGLSYQQIANEGGLNASDLAETGYRLALDFDPDHWLAAWHLGLLQLERRQYSEARQSLGRAARLRARDPDIQLALAGAAYRAHDVQVALWSAEKTLTMRANDSEALRIAALSSAALGLDLIAESYLDRYRKIQPAESVLVQERIEAWRTLHAQSGSIDQLAPFPIAFDTATPPQGGNSHIAPTPQELTTHVASSVQKPQGVRSYNWADCPQTAAGSIGVGGGGAAFSDATERLASLPAPCNGVPLPRMTAVDVTIIRTQEANTFTQGVNLLNGLQIILSGSAITSKTDSLVGADPSGSRTFTRSVALPSAGVTYSLNIFNTTDQVSDVIARPTLLALDRMPSTFFSGSTISVALQGTIGGGALADRNIGVGLSVTPTFIDDDTLLMAVKGSRSFFEPPTKNLEVTQYVSATNNVVSANVIMKLGETLILSGLRERQNTKIKSGVPGLMSLPLVQYLFSTDYDYDYAHHVMILVTPRKPASFNETASAADAYRNSAAFQKEDDDEISSEARGALQARRPSLDAVMAKLQLSRYQREFRTGDLSARRFAPYPSLERVLQDIRQMIYF